MKNTIKIIAIVCLSTILCSIVGCGQEIDSISGTIYNESSFKTIDTWNGTIYNMSVPPKIDEPELPDPNPVITPHKGYDYWMFFLLFILAIPLWIIIKRKNPVYNKLREQKILLKKYT